MTACSTPPGSECQDQSGIGMPGQGRQGAAVKHSLSTSAGSLLAAITCPGCSLSLQAAGGRRPQP